jgi:hypothetical protein
MKSIYMAGFGFACSPAEGKIVSVYLQLATICHLRVRCASLRWLQVKGRGRLVEWEVPPSVRATGADVHIHIHVRVHGKGIHNHDWSALVCFGPLAKGHLPS